MTAVPIHDNPAERLQQIMRTLQDQAAQGPMAAGWQRALGLDSQAEFSDVLRGVAAVRELPAQILAELAKDPMAAVQSTFTLWVEPMTKALNAAKNFEGPLNACTGLYDDAALTSLGAASYVLHRLQPRTRVDDDSMHALLEQLLNLEGEVNAGDFDDDLKAVLLLQLAEMQHMIRLFRVRGTAAFRDAAAFGAGVVVAASSQDPAAHPVLKKLWGFVVNLGTVAQMGDSSLAIAGEVAKMLH